MADTTVSGNGSLVVQIGYTVGGAPAGTAADIFTVDKRGGTVLLTVDQNAQVLVTGDFKRTSTQRIDETTGAANIVEFKAGGVAVASINASGLGDFSGAGVQLPVDTTARILPATGPSAAGTAGAIILWQSGGAGVAYLYLYDGASASWKALQH